ncbi:MAG: glycosyltransferase family 1 protein [Vicinamibacterales bacterium]
MRIAFDARSYFMRTGIARYSRGLVHALVESGPPHDWLILISDQHEPSEIDPGAGRANVEVRSSAAPWLGGATERSVLGEEVAAWGADVFHAIFPPHALAGVPTLTTVFDFSPITHPDVHQPVVREAFEEAWQSAVLHARGFAAASRATARVLTSLVGPSRPRWIVPGGVGGRVSNPATHRAGVLYVGTIEPRKNLPVLLEACRLLADRGREVPLTLIGKAGWGDVNIEAEVARTPGARWLGFVDDATLVAHYESAAVAAFPSSLEGFGLPVLEAMVHGVLPLVSRDEALTELVADPRLVVPDEPAAWADAIARWIDDPTGRQQVTRATTARAREFTWPRAATLARTAYSGIGRETERRA